MWRCRNVLSFAELRHSFSCLSLCITGLLWLLFSTSLSSHQLSPFNISTELRTWWLALVCCLWWDWYVAKEKLFSSSLPCLVLTHCWRNGCACCHLGAVVSSSCTKSSKMYNSKMLGCVFGCSRIYVYSFSCSCLSWNLWSSGWTNAMVMRCCVLCCEQLTNHRPQWTITTMAQWYDPSSWSLQNINTRYSSFPRCQP